MKNTFILACLIIVICMVGCENSPKANRMEIDATAEMSERDTQAARNAYPKAVTLITEKKYDEAEQHIRQHVLKADNMFGPAHNCLGIIYYQTKQYYKAAWEFQYACDLMPNRPEPYNNLGLVYEAAGQYDQATESYKQAMNLEPNNPQFIGNLTRANLRNGNNGPEIKALLEQLVLKETRDEWRAWAKRKLMLYDNTLPQ